MRDKIQDVESIIYDLFNSVSFGGGGSSPTMGSGSNEITGW